MFDQLNMHRSVQASTSTTVYAAMIHERDVRGKIAAVLRNEISIEDFARWIMANSWNMHKDSSNEAVDLVSNIHLLLAERDDNVYSLHEFRRELAALLNNAVIHLNVYSDLEQEPVVRPVSIFSFANSVQVPSLRAVVRSPA